MGALEMVLIFAINQLENALEGDNMRIGKGAIAIGACVSAGALALSSFGAIATAAPAKKPSSSSHYIGGLAGTTITLEGPNQWTTSGSSFGRPWNQEVALFKKVTGVTLKTDVLPLSSFGSVETTQLAAGTAPDLVFNQATYKPYMVVSLDKYLSKPDPFVAGNKSWLSLFNPAHFSRAAGTVDSSEQFVYIPFNLVGVAMYYNEAAFKKAHVTAPIKTYEDLMHDCVLLKKAGYTPIAENYSNIGFSFPYSPIFTQLTQAQFPSLNHFTVTGSLGTAKSLTGEDQAWAIATGKFKASEPAVQESLVLMKEMFDNCATKDWSGITGLSGEGVGVRQFVAGSAAMSFAVDFGYGALSSSAHFKVGSMPFPEITKATTPLSSNVLPRFGLSVGGTSYMIPANTKGKALRASILFLQFMSSPQYISKWLSETGGAPAVKGLKPPASTAAYFEGAWGQSSLMAQFPINPTIQVDSAYEGYLLGTTSLSAEVSSLQTLFEQGAAYNLANDHWPNTSPWASLLPASSAS